MINEGIVTKLIKNPIQIKKTPLDTYLKSKEPEDFFHHGSNIAPDDEYCFITDFSLKSIYTSNMCE